ncbi:hypothetical protein PV325_009427 [Microctonus aethiopoides]|nr:hypothetical protein PV325_009427 [Microctonus aethiopoides]
MEFNLVSYYRWRGSVYKLIWRELMVYLFLYYLINLTYRYGLNEEQQRIFEKVRYYFGNSSESIPMSFVLGFYVSLVVKRWWDQYKLLPWPDNLALFISAAIPGNKQNISRRAICNNGSSHTTGCRYNVTNFGGGPRSNFTSIELSWQCHT